MLFIMFCGIIGSIVAGIKWMDSITGANDETAMHMSGYNVNW